MITPASATPSHQTALTRGTHVCVSCGFALPAERLDQLPDCPNCGVSEFKTASMFQPDPVSRIDLATIDESVTEARTDLPTDGVARIAYLDAGTVNVVALTGDCVKIGRSPIADIRLDDPTVSRRHALVAVDESGLTVYDDRSLNGVFVNGEQVELAKLTDGDQVVIGRFHMTVIA